jgi:hypothetical protein
MAEPLSERERRELAESGRDDVVAGSAVAFEGRRLGQMVSLRLEPEVLVQLREAANRRRISLSDLLREGAMMVLAESQQTMQVTNFSIGVRRLQSGDAMSAITRPTVGSPAALVQVDSTNTTAAA